MAFTGPACEYEIWLKSLSTKLFSTGDLIIDTIKMPLEHICEDSAVVISSNTVKGIENAKSDVRNLCRLATDCLGQEAIPLTLGNHPDDAEFKTYQRVQREIILWCVEQVDTLQNKLWKVAGWVVDPRSYVNDQYSLISYEPEDRKTISEDIWLQVTHQPASLSKVVDSDKLLVACKSFNTSMVTEVTNLLLKIVAINDEVTKKRPKVYLSYGERAATRNPFEAAMTWHADWALLLHKVQGMIGTDMELPSLDGPPLTRDTDDKTLSEISGALAAKARKQKPKGKVNKVKETIVLSGVKSNIALDHDFDPSSLPEPPKAMAEDSTPGHEDLVFPPTKQVFTLIAQPGQSAPFVDSKRVKLSEVTDKSKIVWKEVEPEGFYVLGTFDRDFLAVLLDVGYINQAAYKAFIKAGAVPETVPQAPRPYTESELTSKGVDLTEITRARVLMYSGLATKLLNANNLQNKNTFTEKWFRRLLDAPGLDPVPAARKFYTAIRHAVKNGESVNKVFYGFLMGNLANWKQGELKAEMIDRCKKSVGFYWQGQADAYIKEFNKLDMPYMKVKSSNINKRLIGLAEKHAKEKGDKALSAIKNPAVSWAKMAAAAHELKEKGSSLVSEASRFGYGDWCLHRIKMTKESLEHKAVKWAEKGKEIYDATSAKINLLSPDPTELAKYFYHKTVNFWATPFKRETRVDRITGDGTEVLVSFGIEDRPWWSSLKSKLNRLKSLPSEIASKLIAYKRRVENKVDDEHGDD
jgi:hypothetical protein